jgi:hypothetical protein
VTDANDRGAQLAAHTVASIKECQRLGYRPTRWVQMVNEHGALDTHKQVLRPGPPNDGFVTLAYNMNPPHPELTAEYAALHNFPDLFTEEELGVARGRLENN